VDEQEESEGEGDNKLIAAFSSLHAAASPPAGPTRVGWMIAVPPAPCRPDMPKFSMAVVVVAAGGGTLQSPAGTGLPLIGCDMEPGPPPP